MAAGEPDTKMDVDNENNETKQNATDVLLKPGPNAVDLTPDQDGGVLKEIIEEGFGEDTPLADNKVTVHYVGKLTDGTVFDSSWKRKEPFTFQLGKDQVIKAWDIAVCTMKKGEKSTIYCQPSYAYGAAGSPPKIGPNDVLVFEIELLSWKCEDLSPNKSGGILRRKIEGGEGYSSPKDGAVVTVHLVGRYETRQFDERDVTFVLGEGFDNNVVDGIEIALEKFKKKEKSILKLGPDYAFGKKGNENFNIPPNAEVEYEVTLENFENAKQPWELDTPAKLEQANFCKTKGTKFFKEGKYSLAIKYYKKIEEYLEVGVELEGEEKKEQQSLLLACNLNLAMSYLKTNEYVEARDACDKALEIDPKNEKGLFRRGSALLCLQEMDKAKKDFQAVLQIDPNNKAAANQIVMCNNKIKEYKEKEKKLYGSMFSKFSKLDHKDVAPPKKDDISTDVLENPGTWGEDDQSAHGNSGEKPDELREKYIEAVNTLEGTTEMIP